MLPKNWFPLASLLLLAFVLPSCGGGLTSTTKPTTPTNPAPTVASITPNTGTSNGGTAITITGTGFLTGVTVSFGGTPATGVTLAEQHIDHSDHASPCSRGGECRGHEHG